ncbi:hypothetical protein niasHT_030732 [Heterodera trifolii]|uniref:Uncharacterized protein n=1 Tax=Heterodera trifolii TaxID=157864 RepID=A0ABD2HU06_9BILA
MSTNRGRGRVSLPSGDHSQTSEYGGRGRGMYSFHQQDVKENTQIAGRGRGTTPQQKTEYGRGHSMGMQQQQEISPMRGPRGGRGHGVSGHGLDLHPVAPTMPSPVPFGGFSAVQPTSGRGQLPSMSRYGAYAAFTKQRDQLDQQKAVLEEVATRLEEHKVEETGVESQAEEVTSTTLQRGLLQHEVGGMGEQQMVVGEQAQRPSAEGVPHAFLCAGCQFRADCANLLRAIGALLKDFGSAASVDGGRKNGAT